MHWENCKIMFRIAAVLTEIGTDLLQDVSLNPYRQQISI